MAHHTEANAGSGTIALAGKHKKGYDVRQVDAFLEQAHARYDGDGIQLRRTDIQDASFDIVKGGYSIPQVDATLERLGQAVSDKQTSYEIAELGRVAWKAQTESQYRALAEHARRAPGQRFAPGTGKEPSYDRKQVDRLVDRILAKAAFELQRVSADELFVDSPEDPEPQLTSKDVENVTFTQRKGKHGYGERQVDFYLNACIDVLGRLESYARIADYAKPAAPAAPAVAPAVAAALAPIPDEEPGASFDELAQAEQAIFTATELAGSDADAPATETIPPLGTPTATHAVPARQAAAEPPAPATQAYTLSDIPPITPAPRTVPAHEQASPAAPAGDTVLPGQATGVQSADDYHSPSLAALASMAQSAEDTTRNEPVLHTGTVPLHGLAVPKLSSLSIPDLPMPARQSDAGTPAPADASDAPATAASPLGDAGLGVDIPDLSFPTISTDGPLVVDDRPNEGRHD